MKFIAFILFSITLPSLHLIAQNQTISLPEIGDTIDKIEVEKFVLFEEINNYQYDYSILSIKKTDTLITHYSKIDTTENKVNKKYIESMKHNISKLSIYYKSLNNQNQTEEIDLSHISNPNNKSHANEQAKLDSVLSERPISKADMKKKNTQKYFQTKGGSTKDRTTDAEKRIMNTSLEQSLKH